MYMYKLSIHEDQHSSGNEDEDIYDDGLLVSSTSYRYICLFLSLSFLRFRVKFLGFYCFLVFLFCFVLFLFLLKRLNVKFYIIMKQQTTISILIISYFQNRDPLRGEPWYFKTLKDRKTGALLLRKVGKVNFQLHQSQNQQSYIFISFSRRKGREALMLMIHPLYSFSSLANFYTVQFHFIDKFNVLINSDFRMY